MDNYIFLVDLEKEDLKDHPLATLFPEMEAEEYGKFLSDIRDRGQEDPAVILEEDGLRYVLDGRHRAKASREIGVPLKATMFNGDNPQKFVVSRNMRRRHMTPGQLAIVAARLADDPAMGLRKAAEERQREGGDLGREIQSGELASTLQSGSQKKRIEGEVAHQAAALVGVSRASVGRALVVTRYGTPEDIEQVQKGEASVTAKATEINKRRRESGDIAGPRGPKPGGRARKSKSSPAVKMLKVEKSVRPTDWEESFEHSFMELAKSLYFDCSTEIRPEIFPRQELKNFISHTDLLAKKLAEISGVARDYLYQQEIKEKASFK